MDYANLNLEAMFLRSLNADQRRMVKALPAHLRARLDQLLEDARYQTPKTRALLFADALHQIQQNVESEEMIKEANRLTGEMFRRGRTDI